ncbi:hypothetical protein [Vibrio tritonius]|uniref:hypothetical protein n=1 Tax=Vibrio tritonius TaxID=1435069 RepID=UPI00315DAE44
MIHLNRSLPSLAQEHFVSSFVNANTSLNMMTRLERLSQQQQWILFTAECRRPRVNELAAYRIRCEKIIHMKPSQSRDELSIAIQAIESGNASAVVVSKAIREADRGRLVQLGRQYQCEVFFVDSQSSALH